MGRLRTVAVTDEAYVLLEKQKKGGESFSDVILRRLRPGSYAELAGAWEGTPEREVNELRRRLAAMRRRSDEKLSETVARMGW